MPLKLHLKCRQRLVEAIAEGLSTVEVESGNSLVWDSVVGLVDIDEILPKNVSEIGLIGALSDRPLMHFILEEISQEISGNEWDELRTTLAITELPAYSDSTKAADRLLSIFETLPWEYELFIETPLPISFASVLGDSFDLGSGTRLFVPDDAHVSNHPLPPDHFLSHWSRHSFPKAWNSKCYYFASKLTGFIGRVSSLQGVNQFISRAKALAGFLLAWDICVSQPEFLPSWNRRPVLQYRHAGSILLEQPTWLPYEEAVQLQNLKTQDLSGLAPKVQDSIRSRVLYLPAAFGAGGNQRLLNAARWFFDAHCGSNEPLSFVQAMVVLEILFGDEHASDVLGIGQLIANRCAYLIGSTVSQRDEVIRDITRIYGTRSKIVHRGQDTLSSAERADFARLKRYCRRAIQHEILATFRDSAGSPSQ